MAYNPEATTIAPSPSVVPSTGLLLDAQEVIFAEHINEPSETVKFINPSELLLLNPYKGNFRTIRSSKKKPLKMVLRCHCNKTRLLETATSELSFGA